MEGLGHPKLEERLMGMTQGLSSTSPPQRHSSQASATSLGTFGSQGTVCFATARACKCSLNNPYVIFIPLGSSPFSLHAPLAQKSTPAKSDVVLWACRWEKRLSCEKPFTEFLLCDRHGSGPRG